LHAKVPGAATEGLVNEKAVEEKVVADAGQRVWDAIYDLRL
jgi:hypothetical protein